MDPSFSTFEHVGKAWSNDPLKSTSVDLPRLTVSFHKDGGLQRNGFLYTFLLLSASVLPLFLTDSCVLQKPFAFAVSVVLIGGYDLLGELVNLTCFSWLPSASAALVIVTNPCGLVVKGCRC